MPKCKCGREAMIFGVNRFDSQLGRITAYPCCANTYTQWIRGVAVTALSQHQEEMRQNHANQDRHNGR